MGVFEMEVESERGGHEHCFSASTSGLHVT